jgi:hypothetical protein
MKKERGFELSRRVDIPSRVVYVNLIGGERGTEEI